jgi:hypothetical protein
VRALRSLLVAAAFVAAVPTTAPAQQGPGGLSTDIRIAEVTAKPGEVIGDRVKTVNLTGRSLRVGVLIRDIGAGADGDPISVPRGTGARSAATWVTLNPSQFELGPGATRDVAIRVSVPAGTTPGGYYASVLFDAAGVTARRSSEHLILVHVPGAGASADARIVRFRFPTLSVGGPVDLDIEVANAGSLHAVVGGTIQIKDTFGNRVGTLAVPNAIVLPGRQRLLTVRWASPPPLARIRAVVNLQLSGKSESAAATGFSLAWWVIAAAGLAFALPMYGLARRRRRRRRKAREEAEAAKRPAPPVVPLAPTSEGAWPGAPPEKEKTRLRRRDRGEKETVPPLVPPPPSRPSPLMVSRPEMPAAEETPTLEPETDTRDESFAQEFARLDKPPERPSPPTPPSRPAPVVVPSQGRRIDEPLVVHEDEPEEGEASAAKPGPPPKRKPVSEPVAEEPSWAPIEEPEAFEEWLEAVRSAESDLRSPPARPREEPPPEPRRPLIVSRPPEAERPMPVTPSRGPEPPAPVARPPAPERPLPVALPPQPERPIPVAPQPERPVPVAKPPPAPVPAPEEPEWPEPVWPGAEPASVPAGWQAETGGEALTGAAALRRAKVALDMLAGPTGETGAILDAGLELLRSVHDDPGVVASVQEAFAKNKGRRKLGPLALAMAVVASPEAPAALLVAYATAPKVVADRLQLALEAYDTAELRSHPELIDALPPARRYSLGL